MIRRHTGRTDIPLTARGVQQVREKGPLLVGQDRALDPENIALGFISPRQRARETFRLLFEHLPTAPAHVVTEDVREWDYGKYEGLLKEEIFAIQPGWDIWRDGCPGGESVQDMCSRVDDVIAKVERTLGADLILTETLEQVREHHRAYFEHGQGARDVLIVAHGHFSRVFISRWINFDLALGTHFNVEPGGVAVLSYNHRSLDEPALNALNLYADLK